MTTGCHGDNLLFTSLTIHPTSVMTELFAWMLNQPLSRCFQTLWSLTTSVIIRCSFFSVYAMILRTVCFWTLAPRLVLLSCLQVVCLAFDSLLCLPFFFFFFNWHAVDLECCIHLRCQQSESIKPMLCFTLAPIACQAQGPLIVYTLIWPSASSVSTQSASIIGFFPHQASHPCDPPLAMVLTNGEPWDVFPSMEITGQRVCNQTQLNSMCRFYGRQQEWEQKSTVDSPALLRSPVHLLLQSEPPFLINSEW